jgi:predicted RNA-binding protein (virulence factor B family)
VVEIGNYNTLKIVKKLDFGLYLDGGDKGEILLPTKYVPDNVEIDDFIKVFIYFDSDDRIIATTERPYAIVGDFVMLKVVSVSSVGAFLDWGLLKDLFVPFREQKIKMEEGKSYIVHVYIDHESNRIAASSKLDTFLDNIPPDYTVGQEVDLFICSKTEIGYKAIINNTHWGILYNNEVFQKLTKGQYVKGYIKKIRDDEKIDLSLYKIGFEKANSVSDDIIDKLKEHKGFLNINDKSSSEQIYDMFGVSKKAFKMAVGGLYKKRLISIEENGIRLNK